MNNKHIYYSCCTKLSYQIGQRYYGGNHYVWCTPYFNPKRWSEENSVPPTSNPRDIYWHLKKEVKAGDLHSPKIAENRLGIQQGADAKRSVGVINLSQYRQILEMANTAQLSEFRPLMLVIPYLPVADLLRQVDVKECANVMSEEYLIENLPRELFHVIEL